MFCYHAFKYVSKHFTKFYDDKSAETERNYN